MMPIRIKDIAEVGSGLVVARKKAIHEKDAIKTYKQLNLRAINKNGYIEFNELETLKAKEVVDEYYLSHEGDIIVRLTDPFTAVYITKETEGIVISSNFCIIRCSNKYSPDYLSYYINSDTAKKLLLSNLQGSIMKNINMSSVGELQIPEIPLEKQKVIGNLLRAQTKKIIVLKRILELEEKQQKAILEKIEQLEV